jgi:hypothetical protein
MGGGNDEGRGPALGVVGSARVVAFGVCSAAPAGTVVGPRTGLPTLLRRLSARPTPVVVIGCVATLALVQPEDSCCCE